MPMARETSKTQPCETNSRLFCPLSPLVVRKRSSKCLNEGNVTLRFVWQRNVVIRVPRSSRETEGIATKLLQCGIASKALRRNMPLRLLSLVQLSQISSFLSKIAKIGDGPNTVSKSTVSNTELSEFFCPHRAPGKELSEFLSAYYLCDKANSPSFSQNSPSLPQNLVRLSEFSPKQ